eukprot:TRINITY_DN64861_c0_g1_i1.p1 TRINITY_DN64861_c0_g1~~TRINITY_DN64861_c0_g1_i1.p1  ORF type:complete len:394 (+),score=65.55 TRINITY_DN64861_c0_g1_i1:50-1231(+)
MVVEKTRAGTKVCVFGSGTFGTALGTVVARNGFAVTMLTRREEVASSVNAKHVNPQHLSDCKLPPLLSATTSAEDALSGAAFIIHCIPVQSTAAFLGPLKDMIPHNVPIISTSKGLHSETLETMAELVPRVLGRSQPMAFLSGPTFAKELMEASPSGAIMASVDTLVADACAALFHCSALRIYTTTDVIGVEVGGALKNVYALAAGAVEGMGLGTNPTAFLVTRACAEMNQLAVAMGGRAHTMAGLAGIGDLMLTCLGGASRNKAVGQRIGKGESVADILESRKKSLEGVAEGVATTPAAAALAKRYGVEAPLTEAVAAVLDGRIQVRQALLALMQRPRHEDFAKLAHRAERQKRQVGPLGVHVRVWAGLALAQGLVLAAIAGRTAWRHRRSC